MVIVGMVIDFADRIIDGKDSGKPIVAAPVGLLVTPKKGRSFRLSGLSGTPAAAKAASATGMLWLGSSMDCEVGVLSANAFPTL